MFHEIFQLLRMNCSTKSYQDSFCRLNLIVGHHVLNQVYLWENLKIKTQELKKKIINTNVKLVKLFFLDKKISLFLKL